MTENNITSLDDKRKKSAYFVMMTMPPPAPKPDGPFTVTISDATGKMFEVVFPDYTGELPPDDGVLATSFEGASQVLCNLLTGAMRIYLGTK